MRQWHVPPALMCRQHLLGEHVEHHMFLGAIRKGTGLNGYVDTNCIEAKSLVKRHDALVAEMLSRGMRHASPMCTEKQLQRMLNKYDEHVRLSKVNKRAALLDLLTRCPECRKRYKELRKDKQCKIRTTDGVRV